ncbi:effector-associated domain EAD1-containing protein [Nocardiopsis alborubida]|uniref:CHAT domain-containing protein n=1 Tax=Nocardiopsis alborubida TaxID=146802 RepID=A0A7X6MHX1_9ACTN|nr:effector-associated domain EAD1-containing protein [Nocardiopsis alborubida]NKZ01647.1 hypothetical protein [Nocardiopsis alborubida]
MDAQLTPEEIDQFIRLFPPGQRARLVLREAGFPSASVPASADTAGDFWEQVAVELSSGTMEDGRRRVLEAALRRYPHNPVFLAGYAEPSRAEPPVPGEGRPFRVLVMSANPRGTERCGVERDARAAVDALRPTGAEIELVLAARSTDLRRVLEFRPRVLHLACHGEGDNLVFEDLHGEAQHVPARDIARALVHYRDASGAGLHGLVLGSCDGEHLAPHLTAAAEVVVAHKGRLDEPCAVAFSEHLYHQFARDDDLGLAAEVASHHVRLTDASCAPVTDGLLVMRRELG